MRKVYFLLSMLFVVSGVWGQTLYDSYTDGDFTTNPVWGGTTSTWTIVANSDAAAGATGSNTLRLNAAAVSATEYLSSQISSWGTSQEWGFFLGRRAQALTAANQAYFWLYANESNLNSATVDGYRIAIGDDVVNDEIRLEYIVDGAVSSTVITSSSAITNGRTDFGILIRVTRSATGAWEIFTSTLPAANGAGAIATDIPNSTNANISQGTGTNNSLPPAANGYIGVAALHSTGANAIISTEFDQVYFTPATAGSPSLSGSVLTSFGDVCINTTAGPNSFTITGSSLTTADVTVGSLAGFTYSTTSGGTYTSSLTLTQGGGTYSQDIFVKFSPTLVQSYNGNIVVGGGGATDINVAAAGSGVDTKPTEITGTISSITGTTVTSSDTITATGCSAITAYGVEYSTTNGFVNGTGTQAAGSNLSGGIYSVNISGLTAATTYYYKAYATNNGGISYSSQSSFTTQTPEPTNHPTSFACGTTTSNSIPLTWVDATGGTVPVAYLIKWSSVGFGSIPDPVDGIPEANGSNTLNVSQGIQTANISSLLSSATYYFKIFPYTNSGSIIDYKTNGSVPQTSCTTLPPPIAAWDFTGNNTATATFAATTFDANLVSGAATNITRGAGAAATAALNSFRTQGFQNDVISTSNTDYFQVTLSPQTGFALSLSSINGALNGTNTYAVTPGVSNQFAYSLDGTNFTLIGSPSVTVGQPVALPAIDLTGISALQGIAAGTTVTLRYYASGQTSTGGWGFYSSASGANGLAIGGSVTASATPNIIVTPTSLPAFSAVTGTPSAEQTYSVSGSNLTNDISVTPPVGFEVSTTSGSGFVSNPSSLTLTQSGGTVAATTIYTRMNSATLGTNSGNIANASTGATTRNVAVTGKVLAAEPSSQSAITFGTITTNSIVVNFSGGNGAKRIVLVKSGSAVNNNPVDGTTYTDNATFGSGTQIGTGNYVVYAGAGNTVTVAGLTAGVTYHFAVYEYNDGGTAGAENYLTTSPGTGNATTNVTVVTYTWTNGGADNVWTNSANWSPARTTPDPTDVLQFTDGATYTITGVITQTIRQLFVNGGSVINLQSGAAATLTISGGTGLDFEIVTGSQLNFNGVNALQLSLSTGATGDVNGSMSFTNAGHRLLSPDASGITFHSGAVFTEGTAFAGNPFGTANLNSVVFANGSTFVQSAGSNPFGATQPNSVVVFQGGSLFKVQGNFAPSFSGRTYGNLEIDFATFSQSASGGGTLSIDNLTITQGTLNLGMTGTFNLKGNISVATGATLNFNPASPSTLTLNGLSTTITNSGTLSFAANQKMNINCGGSNGLILNSNVSLDTLTITAGNVLLGNNNLTAATISGASSTSYVKSNGSGVLTLKGIGVVAKTFPVGNAKYNPVIIENGSGHNWSVRAADTITADAGFNTTKAVLVSWIISPSVNPPAGGADITFQFDEATQAGASFSTATNLQAWHRPNGTWIRSGSPAAVNTTAPNAATVKVTGLTAFSQYGLSNIDGPLPVNFGTVKATQQSNAIKVEWSNLTELEVVKYSVERSADGRIFSSIGEVNARFNNGGKADYSFIDGTPFSGVNFYRIRSLETTGKLKYSIVVRVDIRGGATQLVLYPNPSTDGSISYQANNLVKGQYTVRVFNSVGQQVYSKALNHPGGSVSESISIPSVQPGVYSLQLISADNNFVKTFVVQ